MEQLDIDDVHITRNVSVHQICKLLHLFHHTRLDVPVVTYLSECFMELGIEALKELMQSSPPKTQYLRREAQ